MSPRLFLMTANVGSVFEDPDHMLKIWRDEVIKLVVNSEAQFVAIHFQEIGGKNYETSMHLVNSFISEMVHSEALVLAGYTSSIFMLDDDFQQPSRFTALASLYLLHCSLAAHQVAIWNWTECRYAGVSGHTSYSTCLTDTIHLCEKNKFPLDYFPECKWSRKGYMRTRWRLALLQLDLINIHLFHDACNITAQQTATSPYSEIRHRALKHTLDRISTDQCANVPFFMFGDFNFRPNLHSVVQHLTVDRQECSRICSPDGAVRFVDTDHVPVLTVNKKHFQHRNHRQLFLSDVSWLRPYDTELARFSDRLHEFAVTFHPSYPFVEEADSGCDRLIHTRCPAWCDRVLLSNSALPLVNTDKEVRYDIVGLDKLMGDHKPVYLSVSVRRWSGIERDHNINDHNNSGSKSPVCDPHAALRPPSLSHALLEPSRSLPADVSCCHDARDDDDDDDDEGGSMSRAACRRRRRLRLRVASLLRLSSHHSSSGEEWFDEVDD